MAGQDGQQDHIVSVLPHDAPLMEALASSSSSLVTFIQQHFYKALPSGATADTSRQDEQFIRHYHLFAALRLFEAETQQRLGNSKIPAEDPILLGQTPHTNFAPTSIAQLRESANGITWMDIHSFGLWGPNGALPHHLAEQILYRLPRKQRAPIADFFNLFQHRLISLFYRAWANKEPTVQYDLPGADSYRRYVGALAGYGTAPLWGRDTLPDQVKLRFAAWFGGKTRHKEGLQKIILQVFGIPSKVEEFCGEWLPIPKTTRTHLRERHYAKQLGKNTTLGSYSWQSQYKFRVLLGPMELEEYQQCLPGKQQLKQINDTIKNYAGLEMQWEIVLLLKKTEMPSTRIGQYGQLGWTSWLASSARQSNQPISGFVGDVHLHCEQVPR